MAKMQPGIWIALIVLLAGSTSFAGDDGVAAITRPSEDITLSFVRSGQIKEVLVKQGDTVKAGQKLVQLDDAAEQCQLAQLKAQAEDTIRIKAAEAQLDQKKVDLKKIQWAAKRGAATEMEVDHAELDVLIAELSLALAKFEHTQDGRKCAEANIHVSRMRLISPIAGKVEQIHVEAGESVDALEDVIRIVNINPLWADVPVPLSQAQVLKTGQPASIEFDATDNANRVSTAGKREDTTQMQSAGLGRTGAKAVKGKIIHIASVADAASSTLMVRVEFANPANWPAGEHVYVSFIPLAKGAVSDNARDKVSESKSGSVTNKESSNQSCRTGDAKSTKLAHSSAQ